MSKNKFAVITHDIDFSYKTDLPTEDLGIRHCHDSFEILYIVSGDGKYVVEGRYFDIKPGTLMIIRPFEYHCVMINKDCDYERFVVHFSSLAPVSDASKFLDIIANNKSASGRYYTPSTVSSNVRSVFERFETATSLPQNEKEIYAKMLLSELLILLSVSGGEQMSPDTDELAARVIRYLNENIDKDISLDKLAKRFFVSKYYLCRAFKKHNGISVHGYINQKRVMYAKQLIESGETASGAAYKVGFGDYSAFYRAYIKIVGKAPTAN